MCMKLNTESDLEEMLKGHNLMQTPHKGDAQSGIAETAKYEWQAQYFYVYMISYKEIESCSIERNAK